MLRIAIERAFEVGDGGVIVLLEIIDLGPEIPGFCLVRGHVDRRVDDLQRKIEVVFLGEALGAAINRSTVSLPEIRQMCWIASMIGRRRLGVGAPCRAAHRAAPAPWAGRRAIAAADRRSAESSLSCLFSSADCGGGAPSLPCLTSGRIAASGSSSSGSITSSLGRALRRRPARLAPAARYRPVGLR